MTSDEQATSELTVRFYAGAAAAAGTPQRRVAVAPGTSVGGLADQLGLEHGPHLARVLEACTFLVDEVAGTRDDVVPAGATVDVLPPFAGG